MTDISEEDLNIVADAWFLLRMVRQALRSTSYGGIEAAEASDKVYAALAAERLLKNAEHLLSEALS